MLRKDAKAIAARLPADQEARADFFRRLPQNEQGSVLLELGAKRQHELLSRLKNDEVIGLLHYLDPDEATDILHNVSNHRHNEILEKLSGDIREKVEFLLKFNPKSAAGMMSLDFVEVDRKSFFKDILNVVRRHERRTGKFPTILVVEDGYLVGELPGHSFALHHASERIEGHIRRVPHVRFNADQQEVVTIFKGHPHDKIVVLDDRNSILGVIYSDDILRLMEAQEASSLVDFVGASQEEDIFDSALAKVRHRYKWLIINLATAFGAALIVAHYEGILAAFVVLGIYMPIVGAMGSDAGTQTLAVVVRGLSQHEIDKSHLKRIIWGEMTAGAINGLIVGIIVFLVALFWNHNGVLGLVIAVTLFFCLTFSCLFGAAIPILMKSMGKDPATSAAIFITTVTDICGFFLLFWLASGLL